MVKKQMIWEVIPAAVLSWVWYHINKCFFEGSALIWDGIIEQKRVAFWVKIRLKPAEYSINDFAYNLESLKKSCGGCSILKKRESRCCFFVALSGSDCML